MQTLSRRHSVHIRSSSLPVPAPSGQPARHVATRYARGPSSKPPSTKVIEQLHPSKDEPFLLPDAPLPRLSSDSRPPSPGQSLAERFVNRKYLAQDVGNVVHMGHVYLEVPDLEVARLFWEEGLGLTHDPGSLGGIHRGNLNVLWFNIGRQQFHIAKGPVAQGLPTGGAVGIVLPDVNAVWQRLQMLQHYMGSIQLARVGPHTIEVTDPNGINVVVHESAPGFPWQRGICYVMLPCHVGSAAGIASFYEEMLGAPVLPRLDKKQTEVVVGPGTTLMFRETEALGPRTEKSLGLLHTGWQTSLYVANLSAVYQQISAAGLLDNDHQFPDKVHSMEDALAHKQLRFSSVVGWPEGAQQPALLHEFMHEVRSMHHPRYMRPLYNRGASNSDSV